MIGDTNSQLKISSGSPSSSSSAFAGYEDPRIFEPYFLTLLFLDFLLNLVIDWTYWDPLAVLVIFIFQCLGLIVNLIIYVMASGSQAMQSGLKPRIIHHHQLYLFSTLLYISLTCSWYIWALKKSWPSVSDQFSFVFGEPEIMTTMITTTTPTTTMIPTTINTTFHPNSTLIDEIIANVTETPPSSSSWFRSISSLFSIQKIIRKPSNYLGGSSASSGSPPREFYTLWSSGFISLYVIQRSMAIIHYFVSIKAAFQVLNGDKLDEVFRNQQ